MADMKAAVKTLQELTAQEFCKIAEERTRVFVVEQKCTYQEIDSEDYCAYHVTLSDDAGNFVGYARIIDRGDYVTFGRVLVLQKYRKHHYGRQLVAITIAQAQALFPGKKLQIEAQDYVQDFYGSFGFRAVSDVFLLDGIPHVSMLLENQG
ncbi:GNAT family N-acetyltransferase [Scardovia wiggsiae]